VNLLPLIEQYVSDHAHWSASTAHMRRQLLRAFAAAMGNRSRLDLAVEAWIDDGRVAGCRHATLIMRRRTLKAFFAWGQSMAVLPRTAVVLPCRTLYEQPAQREAVTVEEYQRLLAHEWPAAEEHWPDAIRLGWETGLRLADVALLPVEALDAAHRVLTVAPRKTRRRGLVLELPLSESLAVSLEARSRETENQVYVFRAMAYVYECGGGPAALSRSFRTQADKAGVSKSFHCLRHRRVTSLIEAGHSIAVVQSITGHSLSVLQRYLHVGMDAKRRAVESTL